MSNKRRRRLGRPSDIVVAEGAGFAFVGQVDDVDSVPPLPEEAPPNVRAFLDQLEAGQRAGELPDGQRWHLDVGWREGSPVADVFLPRLCSAADWLPCYGGCS